MFKLIVFKVMFGKTWDLKEEAQGAADHEIRLFCSSVHQIRKVKQ